MLTHQTHRIVRQSAVVLSVLISQVVAQDAIRFADVQLTQDGVLQGAVSTTGRPLASAVVEVRYQGKTIAVASSSANGQFAVSKVRPGVHEIVVGSHAQPVRIWASGSAPPQCQRVCQINVGQVSASQMAPTCPSPQVAGTPMNQPMYQPPSVGCIDGSCPPTLPCGAEGCVQPTVCEPEPWGARILPVVVAGSSVAALILAIDARDAADDALAAVASP